MPGATTNNALPYPLATEPVSQGDDAIKALADRLEVILGAPSWSTWTVSNTAGVGFAAGYSARYKQVGKTVHAMFRGTVATYVNTQSIKVPLPVPPHSSIAADATLGTGVVHDPGNFRSVCIVTYAVNGTTPCAQWELTHVTNSPVYNGNPIMGGANEVMTFSITYEAA